MSPENENKTPKSCGPVNVMLGHSVTITDLKQKPIPKRDMLNKRKRDQPKKVVESENVSKEKDYILPQNFIERK